MLSVERLEKLMAQDHQPITQELLRMLASYPDIQAWLDKSLQLAKQSNPDPKTNPAQSIEEYIQYIDEACRLIPQDILNNPSDLIRDQILQSICYFYFLVDQEIDDLHISPPAFKNALQYEPRFSSWLRDFATAWGDYLSTPPSFTDETYRQFYNDPNFRLATGDYESRSNWDTFNRFFSRYLASPDKRPIDSPDDDSIVTSPADSVPQGVWPIDSNSNIEVDGGLQIKNVRYFNVNDLLGPDLIAYHNAFANGALTHTFLNVYDYHRYHFPVSCVVRDVVNVAKNVALEVRWDSSSTRYVPIDSTGWQFTQTRGIVVADVQPLTYGIVAIMPMGMAHVSSVNWESYVKTGFAAKKGDMLGTFLFGGSDFIILFQKQAGFEIQAPTVGQHRSLINGVLQQPTYQHILMGSHYGQMKGSS